MNRKGSISIILLITMNIILIGSMYLNYVSILESKATIASRDKIQAYYLADNTINRMMYDDFYYAKYINPFIINYFKAPMVSPRVMTMDIDFEYLNEDEKVGTLKIEIINKENRRSIELLVESSYKGITTVLRKSMTLLNGIFEIGTLPLISYDLDVNTCVKLNDFYVELEENISINDIPNSIKGLYTFDYNKIIIKYIDYKTNQLIKQRNGIDVVENFGKDVFFIITNKIHSPIELIIDDPITLNGIMFIEGNLVINSTFNFNGILILKGEFSTIVVQSDIKPKFRGIILTEGSNSFIDNIDLKYDSGYIYKYGTYLPGFIDLNQD